MRANMFGDKYCHTVDEVRAIVDARDVGEVEAHWDVYATCFDPPESTYRATCEVVTNRTGETVCYIEADTLEQVRAIVADLKLEVM